LIAAVGVIFGPGNCTASDNGVAVQDFAIVRNAMGPQRNGAATQWRFETQSRQCLHLPARRAMLASTMRGFSQ
jgi:hypothetical protein